MWKYFYRWDSCIRWYTCWMRIKICWEFWSWRVIDHTNGFGTTQPATISKAWISNWIPFHTSNITSGRKVVNIWPICPGANFVWRKVIPIDDSVTWTLQCAVIQSIQLINRKSSLELIWYAPRNCRGCWGDRNLIISQCWITCIHWLNEKTLCNFIGNSVRNRTNSIGLSSGQLLCARKDS